MRYLHDRRYSKELLSLAIKMMGRQQAACDPHLYAICYEVVGGLNPDLATAIEGCQPLTDQLVHHLYGRYVIGRDLAAFDRARQELHIALGSTVSELTEAGVEAKRHRVQIAEAASAIPHKGLPDVNHKIAQHVDELVALLERVVSTLEARRVETTGLLEKLQRSHAEPVRDALTGLLNRLGFHQCLDKFAGETETLQGLAVLMIDVDGFKLINDNYGHLMGDDVLVKVARIICDCIEPPEAVARWGGEEFLIVIPNADSVSCEQLAQRICDQVADLRVVRPNSAEVLASISVSIGIAVGLPGETRNKLIGRADRAMYRAKHVGGNRFLWDDV